MKGDGYGVGWADYDSPMGGAERVPCTGRESALHSSRGRTDTHVYNGIVRPSIVDSSSRTMSSVLSLSPPMGLLTQSLIVCKCTMS